MKIIVSENEKKEEKIDSEYCGIKLRYSHDVNLSRSQHQQKRNENVFFNNKIITDIQFTNSWHVVTDDSE